MAREPRNVRARGELAGLLERRGDADGALAELGRALEIAPDDVALLCARAAILTARGRYDPAEADLRRAVRAKDSADVQLQLGVLFCKRARWREAIEPLRAAVDADPSRPAAHYYLGDAYNSTDDLEAALASYKQAAALDPSHHRALKAIGVVLDRLRRPAEAEAAYQRAREAQRR
jgi:Tfp pilus assembly protein PilF